MKFIERALHRLRAERYRKRSETAEIAFVQETLRPGQCAFDIGAHRGVYLYYMRQRVTDKGRVVAFEPQDALTNHLNKIKSAFGWNNVSIERTAMSDDRAGGTLYVPQNKRNSNTTTQLATIAPTEGHGDFKPIGKIDTDTIDSYCDRNGLYPDFLKIDVEGNELKVLKGAEHTLRNHAVTLLVEIEVRHAGREKVQETFDFMSSLGYRGFLLRGSVRIPVDEFNADVHQDLNNMKAYFNNFIFLKGKAGF